MATIDPVAGWSVEHVDYAVVGGTMQSVSVNYPFATSPPLPAAAGTVTLTPESPAGLPVVAFNRGSISELIKPRYNGEIANIKEKSDQFRESYPFGADQYQGYSHKIQRISRDMDVYSKNARLTASEDFNIDQMMRGYISNAFTKK